MAVQSDPEVVRLSEPQEILKSESLFSKAMRRLRNDRLTMIAMAVIVFFVMLAIAAPFIADAIGIDPSEPDGRAALLPICNPGADEMHPVRNFNGEIQTDRDGNTLMETNPAWLACERKNYLGTDDLGRDHLTRLLLGGQVSLAVGFSAAGITLFIGLILGMFTGYFGGIIDDFMNWAITTLDSIPGLYLLIAISAIFEPSPAALVFILAIVGWTGSTRLIRGQTFQLRDLDYVTAARALGASPIRIMRAHILPNLISVLAVSLSLGIGGVILTEAALSFLNVGIDPTTPTWGNMLTEFGAFFRAGSAHLVIFPGLMISTTVLCLYIIGDGVRDAFDPTISD